MRPPDAAAPASADIVPAYLARLGIEHPGAPSVDALRTLHRAHVERVPYEVLDVHLGRPTSVAPDESLRRVLAGRGGYCVQINGAFSLLLRAMGYDVRWHRAGVQAGRAAPPCSAAAPAPHLALTVTFDDQVWLVDVGLGDGLYDPVPLRAGPFRQGPFDFRLGESTVDAGGWRFDHHSTGSIGGMDFVLEPAGPEDFARWHHFLTTDPESRLVRALTVMRRDALGFDALTGCVLRRTDAEGRTTRTLDTAADWFAALGDIFAIRVADLTMAERSALWTKVRTAHEKWLSSRGSR